jgi:hypothetical protein
MWVLFGATASISGSTRICGIVSASQTCIGSLLSVVGSSVVSGVGSIPDDTSLSRDVLISGTLLAASGISVMAGLEDAGYISVARYTVISGYLSVASPASIGAQLSSNNLVSGEGLIACGSASIVHNMTVGGDCSILSYALVGGCAVFEDNLSVLRDAYLFSGVSFSLH